MKRSMTLVVVLLAAGAGPLLFHTEARSAPVSQAGNPEIALLDSANTKEFFRRRYQPCSPPGSFFLGAEEYQRYFRGWEFVLNENSLPHRIIHDGDLTEAGLAPYRLLILSNAASLSDDQARAVRRWVQRGGRLLATFGSGYKDIAFDPKESDLLKRQEGHTNGLHQLWHDPLSALFGTASIDPGVDVRITRYEGPTACLAGGLVDDLLPYGGEGNLLIQRPEQFHSVLAFLIVENWDRLQPAIITTRFAHGLVVYFAFAPEYIVSKEFGLPAPESCPDGQNWAGRSEKLRILMQCTIAYLLAN